MENAREARRKRLVDRGTDRLAFITGQTQSLPTLTDDDPQPIAASFSEEEATGPRLLLSQDQGRSEASATVAKNGWNTEPITAAETIQGPPKYESTDRSIKPAVSNQGGITNGQPQPQSTEASTASTAQRSSAQVAHMGSLVNPHRNQSVLTASEISLSISESENARLLCAVIVGLLVVLSYHNNSSGGNFISNIISFRPLFLVLLTDATIVFGRVLLNKDSDREDKGRAKQVEFSSTDSLSKALEIGLLLQKALRAASMDCSICAVILTCAFGFMGPL